MLGIYHDGARQQRRAHHAPAHDGHERNDMVRADNVVKTSKEKGLGGDGGSKNYYKCWERSPLPRNPPPPSPPPSRFPLDYRYKPIKQRGDG